MNTYVKAKDWSAVDLVFQAFVKGIGKSQRRERPPITASNLLASVQPNDDKPKPQSIVRHREGDILVWNAYIRAELLRGRGEKALETLEQMMDPERRVAPAPNSDTFLAVIKGFADAGDLEAAFRWTARIHSTSLPDDLPASPPKLADTFNTIIGSESGGNLSKMQSALDTSSEIATKLGEHIISVTNAADSLTSTSPTSSSIRSASIFSDASMLTQSMSITPPPSISRAPEEQVKIDYRHSSKIDDIVRTHSVPIMDVQGLIMSYRRDGIHTHPEAIARVIREVAAQKQDDKEIMLETIQRLYMIAYNTISSLPSQDEQVAAWSYLEDRMLVSMAHIGELEKAALHRDRLLRAGAAPSADSYAAMINSARDTTDDASVALELFEEARRYGVVPNLFLYNIVISKLSRARRTHLALQYFEQMKASGIKPSAVTYGSVIAACCRTGDEKAATFLFKEMVRSPGYRPRVPPFNTMIQFYVSTVPDREKALSYFDALVKAGVPPTHHTYKLLLDAYGAIQPIDIASVKDVFARLEGEKNISITGSHWASLISAYGIGAQDVDKAIETFDSIADHPSANCNPQLLLPDVICYEALFNVFVHNSRADLVENYLRQMEGRFVKPTAYIYNTLIKAYATIGNIARARELFGSLCDPPSGVHTSGNHVGDLATTNPNGVVYREPSTFETMIRIELQSGEHERAAELLRTAERRAFPSAVIGKMQNLVSGEAEPTTSFL